MPTDIEEQLNYKDTLSLPKTDFPMRAGLPEKEPEILERWKSLDMYRRLRAAADGREKYVLHDGPPYANGNIHIGTALNKILKDIVVRSMQMKGLDSNYVPGWDCHGLPIEWKIEEQYRAKGKNKDDVPLNEFRAECREFAEHWIGVQREEFQRLGAEGDWWNPYLTMNFEAEAFIAKECMKFATTGQLYRGSKPIMWSVVEGTALAEAEVEYHEYKSDTIWVKFPIAGVASTAPDRAAAAELSDDLNGASVVIWTTTPWTMPGNRAVCYSTRIGYGLYEVTDAADDNWARRGDKLILADALAEDVMKSARVDGYERRRDVDARLLAGLTCAHPLHGKGYDFDVPLLEGEHVTDEAGTGFVHTAPGHGREDFDIWMVCDSELKARGINTTIPFTVGADGRFTAEAPGFEGHRVITDKGDKGDANQVVIDALAVEGNLLARGRLTHDYPHSWRSKKPVIFRNTPQWFIAMGDEQGADGLRVKALKAIDETRFVPGMGQNRLRGMIQDRPDWVISRQRAWGVPITVFVHGETGQVIPGADFDKSGELTSRIFEAFKAEGADAWFTDGARKRFLDGLVEAPADWEQVTDILDVWFDSGSTHAFCLEQRPDLEWPANLYLEGSDQHRGWFHSSLLESCGTRGRAPYDAILTHGFVMAEDGRKMSKSLRNTVAPQDVIRQNGADILRLWVAASDFTEDLRIGPEILKTHTDSYRRLRNTLRFLLGNLDGFSAIERVDAADMPELERWVLHRLAELDGVVRRGYDEFDYSKVFGKVFNFATVDLSSVYFDIRKDALYCDASSSLRRRACRTVLDRVFQCLTHWLAPMLCFTMEEAWLARFPSQEGSVHLELFPDVPADWRDDALVARWRKVRAVRRVITGALEIQRTEKTIGSSLEAAPTAYIANEELWAAVQELDLAEIGITSAIALEQGDGPGDAFRLDDVADVAVAFARADGEKCQRCWMILPDVGDHGDAPGICGRCAQAVAEVRR